MIANADGLWPLEFTSRFGYPGYSICAGLQAESWQSIFQKMFDKTTLTIHTTAGMAAGVVLNVPPFPYRDGYEEIAKGMPILLDTTLSSDEKNRLHFAEVETVDGQLYTSGVTGCIGTAVGIGANIEQARQQAYSLAAKVFVPNIRYREDIGQKLMEHDLQQLIDWGYIAETCN